MFRFNRKVRPQTRRPYARLDLEGLESRLAPAGTFTWKPNAASGNWSDGNNWVGNVAPTGVDGLDILQFNDVTATGVRATTNDLGAGKMFQSINFKAATAGGWSIQGDSFSLSSGITDTTTSAAAFTNSIALTTGTKTVTLTGAGSLNVINAAGHLSFSGTSVILPNAAVPLDGLGQITFAAVQRTTAASQLTSNIMTAEITGVYSGSFAATAAVVNNGSTLTFSGSNTYTGEVVVNAGGTVVAANGDAFGPSGTVNTVTMTGGSTLGLKNGPTLPQTLNVKFTAGGTLRQLDSMTSTLPSVFLVSAGSFTIDGPSGGTLNIQRGIQKNSGGDAASDVGLTGTAFAVNWDNSKNLSDNQIGAVTVGTGVTLQVTFGNSHPAIPATTPTNVLTINGTLRLNGNTQIDTSKSVLLNTGGVLNMVTFSNEIASLTGGGEVQFGGDAGALTLNLAANETFAGKFSSTGTSTAPAGAFVKTRAGALTLSGDSSAFAFKSAIQQGSAIVTGNLGGPVDLTAGTSLSGGGAVGNIATLTGAAGAKVTPGSTATPGTGILTAGALSFVNANDELIYVLNAAGGTTSPVAGTDYNQLDASGVSALGSVDLNGAKLNVTAGGAFGGRGGRSFVILKAKTITGAFAGFPRVSTPLLQVGTSFFEVKYNATDVTLEEVKTDVSITLLPASSTINYGDTGTLEATVTATQSGAGTPTGNVTFTITGPGSPPAQVVALVAGKASPNLSALVPGMYSISAHYGGDNNFNQNALPDPTATVTVNKVTPTVAAPTASPNPSAFGTPPTYTVRITANATLGAPTGSVTIKRTSDGMVLGTGMSFVLDTGNDYIATVSGTVTLPPGTYAIFAEYSGDTNYNAANSPDGSQTVSKVTPTVAAPTASPNPSAFGTPPTYTVRITANATLGAPTGSVTIKRTSDGMVLGTGMSFVLDTGNDYIATVTGMVSLPPGTYAIFAEYSGDTNYNAVNSPDGSQTVSAVAPTLNAPTASPNPSAFGSPPTYTVTLTGDAALSPNGGTLSIKRRSDGMVLGTTSTFTSLGGGNYQASVSGMVSLPPGTYAIFAEYAGNTNYGAASSADGSQEVSKVTPTVAAPVASPNPSTFGTPPTYTVTLTGNSALSPNGGTLTIKRTSDGMVLGTTSTFTALMGNDYQATVSGTVSLPPGTYAIFAEYAGNTNYSAANSPDGSQTVSKVTPTVAAPTASPNPSAFGTPPTYTVRITVNATLGAPTGSVTIKRTSDGTVLGTGMSFVLDTGNDYIATVTGTVSLPPGTYAIFAEYSGDTNYNAVNSLDGSQTVSKVMPGVSVTSIAPNPSTFGTLPTYTVTLTVNPLLPAPTGTLKIMQGTTELGSTMAFTGSGDTYVATVNGMVVLPPGMHQVFASYSGDGNYAARDSADVTQTVEKVTPGLSVPLVSPDPSEFGSPPMYRVTITVPLVLGAPTGRLRIMTGATELGSTGTFTPSGLGMYTATVNGTRTLNPGAHTVFAVYDGATDPKFGNATSGNATQNVIKTFGPRVMISPPSVARTGGGPVRYTVTYSDPFLQAVTLTAADVILTRTGTATGVVSVVGTGAVRQVVIRDITGNGTLGISIRAGTARDSFGNLSAAAGPSGRFAVVGNRRLTVQYLTPPVFLKRSTSQQFRILVTNAGNQLSRGAFLLEQLPAFTSFNRSLSTAGWVNLGGGRMRLNLGTMRPGEQRVITFTVNVAAVTPPNQRVINRVAIRDSLSPTRDLAVALVNLLIIPRYPRWPVT